MTDEEFEQKVAELRKLTEIERPVKEYEGWHFGERIHPIEDDEANGIYVDGDSGYLILETVGSPEHGNERVSVGYLEDGFDSPSEIALDNIEVDYP